MLMMVHKTSQAHQCDIACLIKYCSVTDLHWYVSRAVKIAQIK